MMSYSCISCKLDRYVDVNKLCDLTKSLEHPDGASTKDMKHG